MSIENDLKRIADALERQVELSEQSMLLMKEHYYGKGAAATEVVEDPLKIPAAKKPGRPAKAATTGANGDGAAAGDAAPATDAAPAPAKEKITEQVLREELRQFIMRHETKGKNKGMEAAADLLKKFNAKTVSTIKPEDYNAIVDHCREDKKKYDAASKK